MGLAAFPTPLLDARLARQRQQAECDRQQILVVALEWLTDNGTTYGITSGYLFGSVTQPGRFSQRSDVDLAVPNLKEGDPFGLMSYLSLHINRDVDLVPLDQCHFAPKIQATGILWKATNSPD